MYAFTRGRRIHVGARDRFELAFHDGVLVGWRGGGDANLAGNLAPAAGASATFIVDNTLPTIAIGTPSGTITVASAVVFAVAASFISLPCGASLRDTNHISAVPPNTTSAI